MKICHRNEAFEAARTCSPLRHIPHARRHKARRAQQLHGAAALSRYGGVAWRSVVRKLEAI